MPHIIPDASPGVILALAMLTVAAVAVAVAALVVAVREHRRGDATRLNLNALFEVIEALGIRLDVHAMVHSKIIDILEYDGLIVPDGRPAPTARPALELLDGGCPDTPAGLEPVAVSRRAALTVVTR